MSGLSYSTDEIASRPVAASMRKLFAPQSVAVVGASRSTTGLGRRVLDGLVANGFSGPIYPVNAQADEIAGLRCYRDVAALPAGVDLAVIAVPGEAVLDAVDACGAAGIRSLVVISAGFGETGDAGRARQAELVARVRRHQMRMIGPNCMGLLNTAIRLNASFSPVFPPRGHIGFSSQSGALGLAILQLAKDRHIGFSTFVSVGNKADVSSNDLLQYWETDPETSVILLYLESFGNPRKFAQLARRISAHKPIIAVKAGRTRSGSRAAGSHTAALAANDEVVEELFRASGVIRADTIDEMFDVAAYLSAQVLPEGRRVGIVTNAGGPGILAVDACERSGLTVTEFSSATRTRLASILSASASVTNPIDMVASAGPAEYRGAIEAVLASPDVDALIVIYIPVDPRSTAPVVEAIRAGIANGRRAGSRMPVLASIMAGATSLEALCVGDERIPTYPFPENAARALSHAADYRRWRDRPAGTYVSFGDMAISDSVDVCRQAATTRGEDWLTHDEIRQVLRASGVPFVEGLTATTAEAAASAAASVGFPVVVKINARGLVHKTEVGGVKTSLRTANEVQAAARELLDIGHAHGLADCTLLIQPMVVGLEAMIGVTQDPLFGSLVAFGIGGTDIELERDAHFRPAPLSDHDAADLIEESRLLPKLRGYRGRPPADIDAVTNLLLRVSQLAAEVPEILEIDLNPVMVLPQGHGCVVVDARIKVGARTGA